jgi:hypothetical protein
MQKGPCVVAGNLDHATVREKGSLHALDFPGMEQS